MLNLKRSSRVSYGFTRLLSTEPLQPELMLAGELAVPFQKSPPSISALSSVSENDQLRSNWVS